MRAITGRLALLALLALAGCAPRSAPAAGPTAGARERGDRDLILATTTSTQDSGLLDVLVPGFEAATGYRVKTIAVGTGAALALGARGEADVVLVHAPEAERAWMAAGNGLERVLVMHNDFVLVGPPTDPAGVRGERSVAAALQQIAAAGAAWVSRDDNSGTDQLEKALWKEAGLDPKGQPWHVTSGQGMGATLTLADQKDAYTLSDRGTYLARRGALRAVVAVDGDRRLLNPYHVIAVDPAKHPGLPINREGATAFVRFLVAPETQRLIGEFGRDKYGQPLFVPDAGKREEELG
ncbi:MAG TPA: substrate-binding domain-containing protein [Chloroflexota bacterium]|jgi:tungstate transport system substrate-binding protein|nr:substrate-binding domain-containing protein [Chloroflexota bacterium]